MNYCIRDALRGIRTRGLPLTLGQLSYRGMCIDVVASALITLSSSFWLRSFTIVFMSQRHAARKADWTDTRSLWCIVSATSLLADATSRTSARHPQWKTWTVGVYTNAWPPSGAASKCGRGLRPRKVNGCALKSGWLSRAEPPLHASGVRQRLWHAQDR